MVTYIVSTYNTGKNYVIQDNTGLSSRVVLDLLGIKLCIVDMDRFYCSSDIYFFTLAGEGIGACGTVQPNRKKFSPNDLVIKAPS